eukprot:12161455-Prorocentrum_lima.AAC.1
MEQVMDSLVLRAESRVVLHAKTSSMIPNRALQVDVLGSRLPGAYTTRGSGITRDMSENAMLPG